MVLHLMLPSDGSSGQKLLQTFFKLLERQNMQSQTILELYTGDNKSKYSSNPKDILKSANNFYKKLYTMESTSKAATTEFRSKISNRKKYLMNNLAFVRQKYLKIKSKIL